MRIVMWDYRHFDVHGGKEIVIDKLVAALVDRGHQICFVTKSVPKGHRCEIASHPALTRYELPEDIGVLDSSFLMEVARFKSFLKSFRPNVVHLNSFNCLSRRLLDVSFSSANPRFAVLLSIHDLPELLNLTSIERNSLPIQMLDSVLVPSIYFHNRLVNSNFARPVRLIPHGLAPLSRVNSRSRLQFLFSGRLVIEKGPINLLRAWARISSSLPDIQLEFIGDGPLREYLVSLSYELGIAERVCWHGFLTQSQLSMYLNQNQILIQPSLIPESFGLSVLESMNQGSACIVSDRGALPELIRDGVDGFVFPAHDTESLASKMLLLAKDKRLRDELGASARKRAQTDFSMQSFISHYESLYEEVSKV